MTLIEDRRTYPTAGGTVVYAPDSLGRSYRAIRTDGVPLGRFRTFEDADAVLRDQIPPDAPPAPTVARCRHCRSAEHATESCPVEAAAEKRREQRRGKRERSNRGDENTAGDRARATGRGGAGAGAEALGEDDAIGSPSWPAAPRHRSRGPRVGSAEPPATEGTGASPDGDPTEDAPSRGGESASAGAAPVTSRTDDVPDLTADPHTLDEYARALAFAAEKTPCKAEDVRRMVWGSKGGRDATELALDELERAGRTDKVFGGRWKPRAKPLTEITLDGESFTWDGPGDSPAIVLKEAVKVVNGPGPHPPGCLTITELADVLDGSTIGDAPEGSPWIDVETPDIPGLSAGTFELPGVPLPRGDRETAPEAPDPAGKTPDGVIADDPDAEVEPTEGDGGLTLGDVVRAADAAGFTVDFSFPKKPRTVADLAAKYSGDPVAIIAREQKLLTSLPERRAAVAKAVEQLRTALAGGEALLVDLDRMGGSGA